MRAVGSGEDIRFLEDEDTSTKGVNGVLAEQLQMLNVASEVDGMAAALDQLAIERGDGQAHSKRSVLVEVNVHENSELQDLMLVEPKKPSDEMGDSIEGYLSRYTNGANIHLT